MAYKRGPSRQGIAKARKESREERFRRIEEMRQNTINRMRNKMKPGMLTGGQAKIAAKAPPFNKIDGKDFAVLRKEKAKGRGKGLQDEKMKPGKVMKAMVGVMAIKKAADKISKESGTPKGMGLGIGMSAIKAKKMKEILGRKMGGKIIKAKKSKFIERRKNLAGLGTVIRKDPTKAINRVGVKDRYGMDIKPKTSQLGKDLASQAAKAAKATRIGKIAAGVAGVALAAKAGLEKMYEKRTGKKPFTKRPEKKMGGGMMMRPNPVGYSKGVMVKTKIGRNKPTKMY